MTPFELEKTEAGAAALRAAGVDGALREARWMMQHAMEKSEGSNTFQIFDGYIDRRARREPLQHILGDVEFYGLDLVCDARALVPRPDSEAVVDAALSVLPDDFDGRIADLGTGSGCLLLAVLLRRPRARGIGVEASEEAATLARENAERTGLADRASIVASSWEDWKGWADCDLIISNPPYIESGVIDTLQPEVRDYDPRAALDGGDDGLNAYRSIFRHAAQLKRGAKLVFEIGFDQAESVPKLASEAHFRVDSLHHDPGDNPRAIVLTKTSSV